MVLVRIMALKGSAEYVIIEQECLHYTLYSISCVYTIYKYMCTPYIVYHMLTLYHMHSCVYHMFTLHLVQAKR